jgi:aspartate aminotransferase
LGRVFDSRTIESFSGGKSLSLSVSNRLARVRPSATGAVLAKATALKREGIDIIDFGAGEPDFDTPEHIRRAAVAAIDSGQTRYTPVDGSAELKAAIIHKFQRENALDFAPEQVIVSGGAKQSLFNLCMALLDDGDEAIIPAPYWVSYPEMVLLAGANPRMLGTGLSTDFKIRPEQLEAALNSKSRLLILNSPGNPTGAAYTAAELRALGEVLEPHPDVVIVADDIYEHVYWGAEAFTTFASACPQLAERTVTVNGVSKAYAMTGWRIGYAAGPGSLVRAMGTIQSQSTSNACSVSQAAATAALQGDQAPVSRMRDAYKERHDAIVKGLNGIDGVRCRPGEGTFYVLPDLSEALDRLGLEDDLALADKLLDTVRVACVPGTAFGAPGHLRLSFACSLAELKSGLDRLEAVLAA